MIWVGEETPRKYYMRKAKVSRIERLEHYLVRIIQQPGADKDQPGPVRALLAVLYGFSCIFRFIVAIRYWFYDLGVLRRFPLGCQVISIGNVTAGGTGKTPVTEKFARELTAAGRKVAILSRGYRRKEAPWWQRTFTQVIEPPLVVSDGKHVLLDAATGGDEPYMLASNLPGVCVIVDRNRVKAGRWAIRRFGCDTLILDDGFQYQRLKHSLEVVLVDKTNPFGNGHMLPRGVLREPAEHISRADVIFLTKSDGNTEEVIKEIREYNTKAEIIECRHAPRILRVAVPELHDRHEAAAYAFIKPVVDTIQPIAGAAILDLLLARRNHVEPLALEDERKDGALAPLQLTHGAPPRFREATCRTSTLPCRRHHGPAASQSSRTTPYAASCGRR